MKAKKEVNAPLRDSIEIIYKAADVSLTGAKKALQININQYKMLQKNIGDKVGTAIGTAYQATSDVVGNVKRRFK